MWVPVNRLGSSGLTRAETSHQPVKYSLKSRFVLQSISLPPVHMNIILHPFLNTLLIIFGGQGIEYYLNIFLGFIKGSGMLLVFVFFFPPWLV